MILEAVFGVCAGLYVAVLGLIHVVGQVAHLMTMEEIGEGIRRRRQMGA